MVTQPRLGFIVYLWSAEGVDPSYLSLAGLSISENRAWSCHRGWAIAWCESGPNQFQEPSQGEGQLSQGNHRLEWGVSPGSRKCTSSGGGGAGQVFKTLQLKGVSRYHNFIRGLPSSLIWRLFLLLPRSRCCMALLLVSPVSGWRLVWQPFQTEAALCILPGHTVGAQQMLVQNEARRDMTT